MYVWSMDMCLVWNMFILYIRAWEFLNQNLEGTWSEEGKVECDLIGEKLFLV